MKKTGKKHAFPVLVSRVIVLAIICSFLLTACGKGAKANSEQSTAKVEQTAQQDKSQTDSQTSGQTTSQTNSQTNAQTDTKSEDTAAAQNAAGQAANAGDAAAPQTQTATQTEAAAPADAGAADAAQGTPADTIEIEKTAQENSQDVTEESAPQETEEIQQEEAANSEAAAPEVSQDVPAEYREIVELAYNYATKFVMSKHGVYVQLTMEEGEGLPEDAAKYAVDAIDVDWNANALQKAQALSDAVFFSKEALYNWMADTEIGEGFTKDEAQYAIDNVSADWMENAYQRASELYLVNEGLQVEDDTVSQITKDEIYNRLVNEDLFTSEEAEAAVSRLN